MAIRWPALPALLLGLLAGGSRGMSVSEAGIFDELLGLLRAHGASPAVCTFLREEGMPPKQLVMQADGPGAWLVGDKRSPKRFTPRGTGIMPLAVLLNQPASTDGPDRSAS